VVKELDEKMEIFARSRTDKVGVMTESKSNRCYKDKFQEIDYLASDDVLMEQILDNINSTPMGRVLKRIASLPEVRKKKVLKLRQQIHQGEYKLNDRLDDALEKVLNDLNS
jgi:anti-sigma28 factor (negative regulator of flagellin synthesis)